MKPHLKQVTTSSECSFKVKVFEEPQFKAEWHFHPQYELTYMVQSTGIRYVGDSMYPFYRGDLVLVGKNVPHSWKTVGGNGKCVKCIIIQWDESLLKYWLDLPEFSNIRKLLMNSSYGIAFDHQTSIAMEAEFIDLVNKRPFDRLLSFLRILNTLANDSSTSLLAGPGFGKALSNKESQRVNQINSYIKDNILEEIRLNEIADRLALSKEAFCRFFKKTFDKTFTHYVNEYKITLASQMLIETELSVSEVGYRSGFNNLSFFHRQFNLYKQMSPQNYRKQFRNIPTANEK
ncbi:AraC family transcriptional regulator [Echinicola strongylocentroti]|uniref:AraC family transcriptional regulator n=1 Tax=Echinicola strongylocentroti TaxID=1795355 RepID=A0A2Z4IF72_9BACT|nr:AraC family transcriptional regulator [Echinicola strongylocentroti]AWW29594.1 AraC family transcriptional regulator [Echinicola strongylocentroti]